MNVPVTTQYNYGIKDRQAGNEPKDPENGMYMSGWLAENSRLKKMNKQKKDAPKEEEQGRILHSMNAVNAVVQKLKSMGHKDIRVEETTAFSRVKNRFVSGGWIVYTGVKPWTDLIMPSYLKELLTTKIK